MMSQSRKAVYPFSVETAMQYFTDADYTRTKYAALGAEDVNLKPVEKSGSTVIVSNERSVPVEVPSFAKKFISPMSKVSQKDTYETSGQGYQGNWRIDMKGAPVVASGKISLMPTADGKGCEHEVSADIDVSVPLVGKKIAAALIGDTLDAIEAELAYNKANIPA
ncbi:hypothetical protein GCM10022278_26990 [Allohahella marinimesophila]|uniref:DUF2505 domain-containing protein n=2 Tax=Allohahella marinimesophila TaxID=1054972 RepID=A0ABP7PLU2_9GAMM